MATAEQLIARIEKLKAARASGILEIRSGDQRVGYRSIDEITLAISADELDLAAMTGQEKPVRRYNFRSRKGL